MRIKKIIKSVLKSFGYMCVKVKTLEEKKNKSIEKFSLNSGERQTSTKLDGIRKDHLSRYVVVSDFYNKLELDTSNLFGMDIFCGNGYGSYFITENMGCKIISIDASNEAISLANKHYSNDNTFFTVKEFPFDIPSNAFDFVISFETIEHLEDDIKLISKLTASLKKGGYLFISAPNEDVCNFEPNMYKFHIKHYTFKEINELVCFNDNFELITWFGNGAYNFEGGKFVSNREENEMFMKEKVFDSHLTYVFRKNE